MENIDIGKINYEAYCKAVGGVSVNGDILWTWDELCERKPVVANAWRYAANELLKQF